MARPENVTLNNGLQIPMIGLGVHGLEAGDNINTAVNAAVESGYRLFDDSPNYCNEQAFGEAIRASGLKREEYFVTTKLRNFNHKYEDALSGFDGSMKALGLDYLDMFLIHFPCPAIGLYCEAWKALEHLYKEGYVRAIGVSNFNIEHLEQIFKIMEIKPAINQFECNPYFSQVQLREFCYNNDIWPQAYFPLGGARKAGRKELLDDQTLRDIGERYDKSAAQVALRWEVQSHMIAIPKSQSPERLRENIDIFDFTLSGQDMETIDGLNFDRRIVPDPSDFNVLYE